MAIILPTVGRMLHFFKSVEGRGHLGPMACVIANVHSERYVTLTVFLPDGLARPFGSVPLIQEGDKAPNGDYCTWMPFQVGQAAKTDELAKKLAGT